MNYSLYIKNHNTKLTSNPTDETTTQKLYEHLNTGRDGSCSGKTGYCVEVRHSPNFNFQWEIYFYRHFIALHLRLRYDFLFMNTCI